MRVESTELRTARLLLRPYGPSDESDFVALATDAKVMEHVGDGPLTDERARQMFANVFTLYEQSAWGIWAVVDVTTDELVGSAELKPRPNADDWEIVYLFAERAWGRGYATEVGRALVAFGFESIGLPRVTATVDFENRTSIRVLEKLGMRFLGEERDEVGPYAVYGVDRPAA